MIGKKSKVDVGTFYMHNWAELFAFLVLIIGFIISILIQNKVFNGIVAFLVGFGSGRLIFTQRRKGMFPYFLVIIGFLLGFMLGSYYMNRGIILILFVSAIIISYYIHSKGYLKY